MQYNWEEVYMWFYKEPLMPTDKFWYLWVRIQNPDRTMLMCNECGKFFKRLHTKHLVKHRLTIDDYRKKYGYQKTTWMVADQESINISKKILGKAHSIHFNTEVMKTRRENHAIAISNWKATWENSNERQNRLGTCIAQIWERLKNYIERFWRPPTCNAMWDDGKALYSLLKHRYGDVNVWFKQYWLPIKKLIPWECVEYTFSDSTVIQVWYKHDNWDRLYAKIRQLSPLFNE
jgi:hypothetical protein